MYIFYNFSYPPVTHPYIQNILRYTQERTINQSAVVAKDCMATTATPRQNKVLSVMSNLLSYKKSVKNGNEKDVQQVSSVVVVLCYLCYLCILPLTHEITAALFTLHYTGFK